MTSQARPNTLFKYVSEEGKKLFENGRILFRKPQYLNDPFDFAPRFSLPDEAALERGAKECAKKKHAFAQNPPDWRTFWKTNRNYFIQLVRQFWQDFQPIAGHRFQEQFTRTGVLCLTEAENDPLMWAHYANSHRGFLIEFNLSDPFLTKSKIHKVDYQCERPVISLEEGHEQLLECVLRKGMTWKYEAEWRTFRDLRKAAEPVRDAHAANDTGGLFDISGTAIKRVVIGFRATPTFTNDLTLLLKKPEYQHVVIERAQPNGDEFKLDYHPI